MIEGGYGTNDVFLRMATSVPAVYLPYRDKDRKIPIEYFESIVEHSVILIRHKTC